MRSFIKIVVVAQALLFSVCFAQTIALPDTNLRNKLQADYPQVMEGNELSISEANALIGNLDLRNANIYDATGVEHFTRITTLVLSQNNLTLLPDITPITGLKNFYASDNQLTELPDLSSLTNIIDFQVMNNELTELPFISSWSNLRSLYISKNQITSLPDLSNFPNLHILVIGENNFQHEIDFASAPELEELHVHKLGLTEIKGLEFLNDLRILFAWSNQIKSLSGLDQNTTLTACHIFNNQLKALPDFSNKPNLDVLDVNSNHLTFEDIKPLTEIESLGSLIYAPQKTIISFDNISVREKRKLSIEYPITNELSTNIYVWQKAATIIDSSNNSSLVFNEITYADTGYYQLMVYNPKFPDLIIYSDTFGINIEPCLKFELTDINITDEDCSDGYSIDLSNAIIEGGNPPFTFEVSSVNSLKTFTSKKLTQLKPGTHTVTIQDKKMCSDSISFTLSNIEACNPIITPNDDGVNDTYYIEKQGEARIYDLNRNLIRTLNAPVVWDTSDDSGKYVDAGYYILEQEGEALIYITIVK